MYFTYILQNQQGLFYIGQTSNLEERLSRHNSGRSRYTKSRGPWQLVYFENHETREAAIKREREIKKWKSAAKIRDLIEQDKNGAVA